MIPREKIVVAMPVYNSLVDAGCVNGLLSCIPFYCRPFIYAGNSSIALARNVIAHTIIEKMPEAEWVMWIDADTRFTPDDWKLLWEGEEEIVCAEYARKILGMPPVQFGLGFTRVHRSVYERIKQLTHEDGAERVNRFYHDGQMLVDYHPNGALQSGKWIGEDQGFFMWANLTGAKLRLETRTRLVHAGTFGFGYPDQIPGFKMVDAEDGAQ
jgi:hypothetical protein